jgi:hypothetical protein
MAPSSQKLEPPGNPGRFSDLVERGTEFGGDRDDDIKDDRPLLGVLGLEHLPAEPLRQAHLALPVLAREHPAAERGPGHHAEPEGIRRREQVVLGPAVDQAVLELRRGGGHGPGHLPEERRDASLHVYQSLFDYEYVYLCR